MYTHVYIKGEVDHPLTPSSTPLFVFLFESPSQKIRFSENRFLFRHTTRERNRSWDGRRRPSSSERLNVAGFVSFLAPITSNARNCRLSRSSSSNRRRSVFSNGATGNKAAESSFVSLRFRPAWNYAKNAFDRCTRKRRGGTRTRPEELSAFVFFHSIPLSPSSMFDILFEIHQAPSDLLLVGYI